MLSPFGSLEHATGGLDGRTAWSCSYVCACMVCVSGVCGNCMCARFIGELGGGRGGGGGGGGASRERERVKFLFVSSFVACYKGIVSSCSILVHEENAISSMR